jgi:hypothetical protein
MKNKNTGKSYNIVKALVETEEKKQQILNERFIRIGLSKIYVEDFIKPPTQCRKCKGFGHIEKLCKSNYRCGKCGDEHKEDDCQVDKAKSRCVNCMNNHSSFYRGCIAYREAKKSKVLGNNKQSVNVGHETNNQATAFQRTYSSSLLMDKNILNQFNDMLKSNISDNNKQIEKIIIKQTEEIIKRESVETIKTIERILKLNNMKLCYFVIDTIKALVTNVKLTNVKIESIAGAFRDHELGNIQVDDMVRYYCPKSVKITSTNADDVNEDLANRLTYTPFCSN